MKAIKNIAIWVLVLFSFYGLRAQYTPEDSLILKNLPEGKFELLTDDIFPNLHPHIGRGLLALPHYYQWKRKVSINTGLDYVLVSSPIYQYSTTTGNYTGNVENDFMGRWRLIENEKSTGNISFWLLHVYNFTDQYTKAFSQSQGLASETSLGDVPYQNFGSVMALWWEQNLINDHFMYRIGHLNSNMVWGNNKYINDDRDGFMNTISSSQQGVSWVGDKALGVQTTFLFNDAYIAIGLQDANGANNYPNFESFANGNLNYLGEVGWTPSFNKNSGKISITLSSKELESGDLVNSFLLNLRQDFLKGKLGAFARYGVKDRVDGNALNHGLTIGTVWNGPFGFEADGIGLAFVSGSTDYINESSDEGLEWYYRLLLTHRLDFTVDVLHYWQTQYKQESTILSGRLRFIL